MKDTKQAGFSEAVREFAVETYVNDAKRRGLRRFSVNAGDVHKAMHLHNRVPLGCNALQSAKFLHENRVRIVSKTGPPSGLSTSVTITYEFADESPGKGGEHPLVALRGLLRDVFRELGGGENFIRGERQAFSSAVDRDGVDR